jgi:L-aspartate oxidase
MAVERRAVPSRSRGKAPAALGGWLVSRSPWYDRHQGEPAADAPEELACDVVIIGGGIAGLTAALSLPAGLRVVLMTKSALGESNTRYAQGGLAAAIGADDDPELHLRDTLVAGAGLVEGNAARILVQDGPDAVGWLIGLGAEFDQRAGWTLAATDAPASLAERYALGREAAHSRWRVLHAHGDATGAEIERALVEAIHARASTTVLELTQALDFTLEAGRCAGVLAARRDGLLHIRATRGTVLANGGAGQLWRHTSNPAGATADGLALAWRAGATLADLEFVQFHPTVLVTRTGDDPFLISEAVRGEGAYLRNAAGERFMARHHPDAELAPRDVVARAIQAEMRAEGVDSAFLDLRHLPAEAMRARFPSISAVCARYGLDLARDLVPVAPAAHYFMGGVAVDTWARTSVPALFAVGEVACTGVHGANRLASNSLLEGLVFGRRAARALAGHADAVAETAPLPGALCAVRVVEPTVRLGDVAGPVRASVRDTLWDACALRRDAAGLRAASARLAALAAASPVDPETANMLTAAQLIAAAALGREESRGAHYRTDFPETSAALAGHHTLIAGRPNAAATTSATARAAGDAQ